MGYAIAKGITKNGIINKKNIIIIEKNKERVDLLKKEKYKVFNAFGENKNLQAAIIAVKPGDITQTLNELKNIISKKLLIISIAAGVTIKKLSNLLNNTQPIARVMPNTPAQIGEGMSVITFNKYVSKSQRDLTDKIFNSLGKVLELNEDSFDLVTAISGSGPAYFCYLIECLINTAKKLGMKNKTVEELVLQTGFGTLKLLESGNINAETLRRNVTSPGGTTEAALKVLYKNQFDDIVFNAIKAAKDRCKELSK